MEDGKRKEKIISPFFTRAICDDTWYSWQKYISFVSTTCLLAGRFHIGRWTAVSAENHTPNLDVTKNIGDNIFLVVFEDSRNFTIREAFCW